MYHHDQQQTQGIDDDVPLAAFHFLMRIDARRSTSFGRFHALTVDDRRARVGLFAHTTPDFLAQCVIDTAPGAITRPFAEVVVDVAPAGEVMRQEAPLDASPVEIEDSVDDCAQIDGSFAARTGWLGQQRGDDLPFTIGHITGIAPTPSFHRWRRLLLHGHGLLLSLHHSFPCDAYSTIIDYCTTSKAGGRRVTRQRPSRWV